MDNFINPTPAYAEELVAFLKENSLKISFAESCTGGLASAMIISVTDASSVIDESYVTYSNESKIKNLGVKKETIDSYGVVSEEVAAEMAGGVCLASGADIGVGITGIAGPGGGSELKPVGMVCFGFSFMGKLITKTVNFGDIGRNEVRLGSVTYAVRTLLHLLSSER